MNLVEILKEVPIGTKLYSPLLGDVYLKEVNDILPDDYPITVFADEDTVQSFCKDGRCFIGYPGECVLFPSKDNRDWNTFNFLKAGDIIVCDDVIHLMKSNDAILCSYDRVFKRFYGGSHFSVPKHWLSADKNQRQELFEAITCNGYKYHPEDISLEKIKVGCSFKPFDKVLVRYEDSQKWNTDIFRRYVLDKSGPYYDCFCGNYPQCILYEGNEDLFETTNDPQ